jgi:aspartate/methionine/tyrosine aminotransferase
MVPGPVQAAVALAYGDDAHVVEQRARYLRRLELLSRALKHVDVDAPMPEGSFYLWCARDGMDGWELATLLAERSGLVGSPGELYGDAGKNFVRIAVVQPDERLELVASRLEAS